jgi:protein O-GlcNAc transferase
MGRKNHQHKTVSPSLKVPKERDFPVAPSIQQAIEFHQQGQLVQAEALYRRIIEIEPKNSDAIHLLGVIASQTGHLQSAVELISKAIEINPNVATYHSNCGSAFNKLKQFEAAVGSYDKAIALQPSYADAYYNRGNALVGLDKLQEAIDSYIKATSFHPNFVEAYFCIGNTLQALKQFEVAIENYDKAVSLKPDFADAYFNCANALSALKQFDKALIRYDKAIYIKPDYAEAYSNRGNVFQEFRQFEVAIENYDKAISIKPDYAEAYSNRGNALQKLRRFDAAIASYEYAISVNPNYADAYSNRGNALLESLEFEAAISSYDKAISIKPDNAEAHFNRGKALVEDGRIQEGEACYRTAIELNSDMAEAYENLGYVLQLTGRHKEAMESHKKAIWLSPGDEKFYSSFLFCISHIEEVDAQELFDWHHEFGERFEAPLRSSWPDHKNQRDPSRCIKVGFVSGDFRNHAVARFIDPVLEFLSTDTRFSLYAYHNFPTQDATTEQIKTHFSYWSAIYNLTDEELAQKIGDDQIDILIDLSGHTAYNRMLTFARKPAPIQISWIGYPGTTGLKAIDYFIADNNHLPKNKFDKYFTERIVRLPLSAVFVPYKVSVAINLLPAISNGYLTFGSFNRINKITRSVISLWSELLRTIPDSKMILGAMPAESEVNILKMWFEEDGINSNRVIYYTKQPIVKYLSLHNQIDICLDTFPYNGGTTIWHALWMGVPTLTLAGDSPFYRSGACVLGSLGLSAFVTEDKIEFVQKGVEWSNNIIRLSEIRNGMRELFQQSKVVKPKVFTSGLAHAFRVMWQGWCERQLVEPIEITEADSTSYTN